MTRGGSCFACVHIASAHVRPACKHTLQNPDSPGAEPLPEGATHTHMAWVYIRFHDLGEENISNIWIARLEDQNHRYRGLALQKDINSAGTQMFAAIGATFGDRY